MAHYSECLNAHEPNDVTKIALENAQHKKALSKAESIEDLFKKLDE